MSVISEDVAWKTAFKNFRDTGVFERYMLNSYQFSAAKTLDEGRLLQAAVYEGETVRGYSAFKRAAREITDIHQETWLRTEYDNARQQMVASQEFRAMRDVADLYPYWVYKTRHDARVRPEHAALEGKIFRMGDPNGDACYPPVDWNCRCNGESADGRYLEDNRTRALTAAESKVILYGNDEDGKPYIDPQFRYNPADQGMMPRQGRYFDTFPSANSAGAKMFKVSDVPEDYQARYPETFAARTLHHLIGLMNDWRRNEHADNRDNVIFQNAEMQANITFGSHALHAVSKHPRNIEFLPQTLKQPDEIWMSWENLEKQLNISSNYITFMNRAAYVVQVKASQVTDAFAVAASQVDRYRRGLPFIHPQNH